MLKFTKSKKNNKNGFAMAELLAVCIVVLTIFTILFSNYLPLVAEYENRSVYNNVTSQYAAHHFRKLYMEMISKNSELENILVSGISTEYYFTVYGDSNEKILEHVEHVYGQDSQYETEVLKLLKEYKIEEIIITTYQLKDLKENYHKNGKLYNYIKYLPSYSNHFSETQEYRIILKSSDFGYATTPLKYEIIEGEAGPNHPELSENMIAVRYDETDNNWVVADSKNENASHKWYDYEEKMWANSVTVSEANRDIYLNAELGTVIPMEDILTMQVWIPRFKYTVWNYNSDGSGNNDKKEFPIEIFFEEGTESTGDIRCDDNIQGENSANGVSEKCYLNTSSCTNSLCNGETYTHPAFTFGKGSTEEVELTGFWVGKFEISTTESSACYSSMKEENCNMDLDVLVLPSKKSYRWAQLSTFANNIMAMNNDSNIYGFETSDDTHMISNMEWGAVAYLSHSEYGTCENDVCKEIGINGFSERETGCGVSSSSCQSYDADGVVSSTTGNIYGIYDMNGGTSEYVMGNMAYDTGGQQMVIGHISTDTSGYRGVLFESLEVNEYTEYNGIQYPDAKYVNKYSFTNNDNAVISTKLGDGIRETDTGDKSWWGDKMSTLNASDGRVWYVRGGEYDDIGVGENLGEGGIFNSFADSGGARRLYTSRLAIAIPASEENNN